MRGVKVDAFASIRYPVPMRSSGARTQLVWTRLVRAHVLALASVQDALAAANLPALEWYDVLWELETGGELRQRDLQGRLLLAQYNLSRLLDRMAAARVVERRPCPEDRRGQMIIITAAGLRLRQKMWPVYAEAMAAAVGDRLTPAERTRLADLLARLGMKTLTSSD